MSKRCETFEHTADVGLAAEGETQGELFEALAEGLADYICPRYLVSSREKRPVVVGAEDATSLAVDFLGTVLNIIQVERFLVASVTISDIGENHVAALLWGEPYEAARHELQTEVKAVTYHQLKIAQEDGRWVGRVILDL